tara:strand:- start:669 stop:1622 length:954 start_codon:yes stop_codon:yes gene_type:complete
MKHQFRKNFLYFATYHFIRKKNDIFYKNINYLDFNKFKNQITNFEKIFNIIGFDDALDVLNSRRKYKKPFLLLTFDDGYMDHYKYVLPFLLKKKHKGLFYPFANSLKKGFITDTNKIHFILAKNTKIEMIENEIITYLKNFTKYNLKKINVAREIIYKNRRYDNHKISFVKRLLQYYLPSKIRYKINDYLFKKLVTKDKLEFYERLYLKKKHLKEMKNHNMHFGSHGTSHNYLGFMSSKEQNLEIKNSLIFLKNLFPKENNFSICYPYGSFNKETIKIVKKYNFKLGLSNSYGSVNLQKKNNLFTLPRYDTNDFIFS